jgi:hypothetical protein
LEQNPQFWGRFSATSRHKGNRIKGFMERAMGIEPMSEAWEALTRTLKAIDLAALSSPNDGLDGKLNGN